MKTAIEIAMEKTCPKIEEGEIVRFNEAYYLYGGYREPVVKIGEEEKCFSGYPKGLNIGDKVRLTLFGTEVKWETISTEH